MLRVESSPFAAPNHNSTQLCWLTCGLLQPCISTQRYAFQEYEHRRTIRAHTRCTHTANALARLTFPARLARLARLTWTGNTPLPVRARQARRAGETLLACLSRQSMVHLYATSGRERSCKGLFWGCSAPKQVQKHISLRTRAPCNLHSGTVQPVPRDAITRRTSRLGSPVVAETLINAEFFALFESGVHGVALACWLLRVARKRLEKTSPAPPEPRTEYSM